MFTLQEVKAAKETRDTIIKEGTPELKSIYMAGEIVMWDQLQSKTGPVAVLPKTICDKCGGKIRRTHVSACPENGLTYCEKCIDPEGKIYNDAFFGKTDR